MPVLIDTNVIADVLHRDPVWEAWSDGQINQHKGNLWVNPMIYAELCYRASSTSQVDFVLTSLGLYYQELPKQALFLAAQAFRIYKLHGGTKSAPLPDFFIAAHAEAEGFIILTRDTSRYQTYFPNVSIICP